MISSTVIGFFANSPLARKALLYGSIMLAVILILLGFRRAGVKAGERTIILENQHAQAKAAARIKAVVEAAPSTRDERISGLRDGSRKL
jgi:hypothetical protein